jgi:hypothetical protein
MPADTMVMLELLEEAGAEAVTLDELGVAGVRDPARALLELELAGLEIQRVLVRAERQGRAFECIRLAHGITPEPAGTLPEQPTVELAAVAPRPAPEPAVTVVSPREPRLAGYVLLAALLALVAVLLRRR